MSFLDIQQQHELEVHPYLTEDLNTNWQMMWQTRAINTDKNYVETAAFFEARKRLWYTGWVTLCGNIGDGKSSLAEHLVCSFVRGAWTYPQDPNFGPNQTRVNVERQKCLVDGGFGHIKKLFRRVDCDSLSELASVVNKSASSNTARLFRNQQDDQTWQWYRKVAIDEETRECYTPVFVHSADDYRQKVDHGERQIVVIDDVFGAGAYDVCLAEGWRGLLEDMLWNITAAQRRTLVVLTVSPVHLHQAPSEISQLEWFRQHTMCDLSAQYKPSDKERPQILNSSRIHLLPKEEVARCGHERASQAVGLVYRMYSQVKSFSMEGQQFFRKPWTFAATAIDGVYQFDRTLYYSLAVAVLLDGRLDLSRPRLADYDLHTVTIMEQLIPILAVPEQVDLPKMRFAARLLTGFFITPVEKWVFQFSHSQVYFLCAQSLCKRDMKKVIELCSRKFLLSHIRALDNNQNRDNELVINCEPRFYACLGQRYTGEVLSGRVRAVVHSGSCDNEEFVKVWFRMMKESGRLDAVLHEKDDVLKRSMVYWACFYGKGHLVKQILDVANEYNLKSDASFKQELIWGMQAACGSLSASAAVAVRCLVEQGVYVNLTEKYEGENAELVFGREMCMLMRLEAAPIHTAALRGHPDLVHYLLQEGANINEATEDGYTPLHRAAMRRDRHAVDVVKLLISNKADLNAKGVDELTPVDKAVRCGHGASVEALIVAGAEVKRPYRGKSVMSCAVQNRMYSVVELLLKADSDGNSKASYDDKHPPLAMAVYNKDMRMLRLLLDNQVDINYSYINGWPALHTACYYGDLEMVQFLIDRGANVNLEGPNRNFPLHFAATAGRFEICELLLAKGAKTEAQNSEYQTPLVVAAKGNHQMVVWLLLREGMMLGVDNPQEQSHRAGY